MSWFVQWIGPVVLVAAIGCESASTERGDRRPENGITWSEVEAWDARVRNERTAIREEKEALTSLQQQGSPQLAAVEEKVARWRTEGLSPYLRAVLGRTPEDSPSAPGGPREKFLYGAGRVEEVKLCSRETGVISKYGERDCVAVVLEPTVLDPENGPEAHGEDGRYWLYYPSQMTEVLIGLSAGTQVVFRDCETTSKSRSWIACDMTDYDAATGKSERWWLGSRGESSHAGDQP